MIKPERETGVTLQPHSDAVRRRVLVVFFLGLLVMAAVAVLTGWMTTMRFAWLAFDFGWFNRVLGLLFIAAGSGLVIWSVRSQYVWGKGTPAPAVATLKLVVHGPYAYTRNPMTLGALLLYLGIGICMGSGAVIALTGIVFTALLTYINRHETAELAERFGDEYLVYKKRTSFLVPFPHCWRKR